MGFDNSHRHTAEVGHDMVPENDGMLTMLTAAGLTDMGIEDRPDSYLVGAQKPGGEDR